MCFLDKSIEIHLFVIKNCCHKIKHPVTQPICDIMGFLMGSLNLCLALKGCSEFSDPLLKYEHLEQDKYYTKSITGPL